MNTRDFTLHTLQFALTPVPRWPLALLGVLALGAIAFLAWQWVRRKRVPPPPFEQTDFARALKRIDSEINAGLQLLASEVRKRSESILEKFDTLATPEQLHIEIAALRKDVARLAQTVEEFATTPPPRPADQVVLEHQILGECWKQFRENKELSAAFDSAVNDIAWDPLLTDLGKLVPDDLRSSFETVVAPCREHLNLIKKIVLVPRVVSGEIRRRPTDAEELMRTRDYATLLTSVQSPADNRLSFRFRTWVTDTFLPFADQYLQRYQIAQFEKRDGGDLNAGVNILRRMLQMAAVEPIDVTLGETPFDSTRHIGRSTSNDPHLPDGVITGVVRNGFVERGQQIIRQPEVIVNRMR